MKIKKKVSKHFKLKKQLKKDDKSNVRKSCIDVAPSSNMDIVEDYYKIK